MKILVPIDGSDNALKALSFAANMALGKEDYDITVLFGIAHDSSLVQFFKEIEEDGNKKADIAFKKAKEELEKFQGVNADFIVKTGFEAADIILKEEYEGGYDTVVMGSRGLNSLEKWLVGSVSTKVAKHSACTVILAR
ncbi:MAG: universal stress protein [Anaerovoracaceae bacterium]